MYVAGCETRPLIILGYQSLFPLPSGSLLTFVFADTCFRHTKDVFYETSLCKKILFIWLNKIRKKNNITEYTNVWLQNRNYFRVLTLHNNSFLQNSTKQNTNKILYSHLVKYNFNFIRKQAQTIWN